MPRKPPRKPKQKLTKRAVEGLQCEEKEFIVWDTEIPGFGVRVRPSSGRRVYILKYRTKKGTPRKPAIGRHGSITAEQARSIARTWLAEVHKGGDPAAETEAGRNAPSLGEVLAEVERTGTDLPSAIAAIRPLLFTGCRRSEILTLQWEHVVYAAVQK